MQYLPAISLTPYEVRHFVQPPALRDHDPIALLNEYLIREVEAAMIKNPTDMRAHLVSLYHFINTKPEIH